MTVSDPMPLYSVWPHDDSPVLQCAFCHLGHMSVSVCMMAVQPWPPSCAWSLASTVRNLHHQQDVWPNMASHLTGSTRLTTRTCFAMTVLHSKAFSHLAGSFAKLPIRVLIAVFRSSPGMYLQSQNEMADASLLPAAQTCKQTAA